MGRIEEQSAAWRHLMTMLNAVIDPILKNAMKAEFTQRAISEWGYNPNDGKVVANTDIKLDDWGYEFLKDIKNGSKYLLDTRSEKRKQEEKELRTRMYQFIQDGGLLTDIPVDIRSDYIIKIYLETLENIYKIDNKTLDSLK